MKKYAVLSWPRLALVGFVWAKDCARAQSVARKIWQGGVLAVRRESK